MNGLEQADNQSAHSMTLAIMSVVNLFRRAQCERTIHLEILGFSISYNHKAVQLYCHYPVINGENTAIYRSKLHRHDFDFQQDRDRWKSYRFVRSVYERWAPMHFKRLCDAIDRIDGNFDVSSLSSNNFGTELTNELAESIEIQGEGFLDLSDDNRTIQGGAGNTTTTTTIFTPSCSSASPSSSSDHWPLPAAIVSVSRCRNRS